MWNASVHCDSGFIQIFIISPNKLRKAKRQSIGLYFVKLFRLKGIGCAPEVDLQIMLYVKYALFDTYTRFCHFEADVALLSKQRRTLFCIVHYFRCGRLKFHKKNYKLRISERRAIVPEVETINYILLALILSFPAFHFNFCCIPSNFISDFILEP